jgi:transposase-like protein
MESAAENTADGGGKVGTRVDHRALILLIDDEPDRGDVARLSLVRAGWTRRFFTHALKHGSYPTEVNTDRAPAYVRVLDEVLPGACTIVEQYANNPVESDYERLKARLRPMGGLKRLRSARVISTGHAFMQIKYDAETKAEAVPLITDHAADYEREWAAVTAISQRWDDTGDAAPLGAPGASGRWPAFEGVHGVGAVDPRAQAQVPELEQTIEVLKAATSFLRGSATRYTADLPVHHLAPPGVRGHTDLYRVDQSWCVDRPTHVLRAPGTGAVQTRLVRNVDHRDPVRLLRPDAQGHRPPGSLYGGLKMWAHLQRQGVPVARLTVERLMRGLLHPWRIRSGRQAWSMDRRAHQLPASRSSFAGFRFPSDVITIAVRWYLRYGLSYRDVEELLAERGITVDDVTVYRWVQRFTPLLIEAARPCRHVPGDRWFVDETYVKVAGRWRYLYRAIDQYGEVVDVLVSLMRDLAATRRFFSRALEHGRHPTEVNTDRAPTYPRVVDELLPTPATSSSSILIIRLRPITVD